MYSKKTKPKSILWIEFLLITSICLMPFTKLKFIGPVGPSELLVLVIWVIIIVKNKGMIHMPRRLSFFTTTLRNYIILCVIGFFCNLFNYSISGNFSSSLNSALFDFLSYCFNLLTLYEIEFLMIKEEIDAEYLLNKVVNVNCLVMPILYIVSRFTRTLFGMRLLYAGYFAPFANNLHHTSMYLLPLAFLSLYFFANDSSVVKKVIYIAATVFFAYCAIDTGSTKAVLSVVAGAVASAFYMFTTRKGKINKSTTLLIIFVVIAAIVFVVFNFDSVWQYASEYFVENDGGGGRSSIWTSGLNKWTESPILGLGPGSHSEFGGGTKNADAHNTFLAVMLQTGLAGLILYLIMWYKTIKKGMNNGYILAMYLTFLVYSAGGDTLRRIPVWVFSVLAYYVLEKKNTKVIDK